MKHIANQCMVCTTSLLPLQHDLPGLWFWHCWDELLEHLKLQASKTFQERRAMLNVDLLRYAANMNTIHHNIS